jgi:small basic protein
MILLPILAVMVGAVVAYFVVVPIHSQLIALYLAVACLAGLDTVLGGVRSGLEGKFHTDVFVTGFISNIVIAFFLAWLGDAIRVNLYLAVALVLGARIFTNLSLIRRFLLTKWQDARERKRLHQELLQPSVQSQIQVDTAP